MRIIDTGITKETLTGDNHPQLKILDKLYTIDDRKATYDKINEIQNDNTKKQEEKESSIFDLALGKKEAKEILSLDLSVQQYMYFTYCVLGAITGEEPDKLMEEARRKN